MNLKKNTITFLCICLLLLSNVIFAQQEQGNIIRCASDEYNKELLKSYPNMMGSKAYEDIVAKQIKLNKTKLQGQRGGILYTIPVVVHVVHNGEAIGVGANISEAQVLSQITVLNEDFRRLLGSNGHNTHPDGADVEIEFCLAKQTPDGCITNGINRINMSSVSTTWSGPGGNTDSQLKPTTIWDSSKYMNIWTVNFSDNTLLGYAQFPNGPANTDGVVVNYMNFGSNDDPAVTISGDFNLGRTATHEVGHYLNLYHTFQGGCAETGGGDLCADTPPVANANSNSSVCVANNSCTEVPTDKPDMIENYMDYSTDVCMNVFTNDQKTRIIAAITGAPNRPTTLTSNVCNALASVNDDASIGIESIIIPDCIVNATPSLRITNWGTVTLTSATVTYDFDGGTPSNYNWTGALNFGEFEVINLSTQTFIPGSHTFNASVANPNGGADLRGCNDSASSNFTIKPSYTTTTQIHLTLVTDDYGGETTWELRDSSNVLKGSGGPYASNTTINESIDVVLDECYTFTIFDSASDGICCGFGSGSYQLETDDNTVIVSGGSFGASEATAISTITLDVNEYFINNRVSIYPNPTSNILNIKLANGNELPESYQIYNMLGQLVSDKTVNHVSQLTINTATLSNGMYFLKVFKEGSSKVLPFIKK